MSTPTPGISGSQIKDQTIERHDLNTTVPGQAVVERLIAGTGITLSSTGADTGTGDVTISATGGGGTGGGGTSGSASPATATSFGTVETDITESGGSVVYTKTTMDSLLAGKISVGAALPESEITGLLTDLAGKITSGAALPESEITNLVSDLSGKIAAGTSLPESEITGLLADLAGKLASGAAIPESEITNLAADLAARLVVAGTPAPGQVPVVTSVSPLTVQWQPPAQATAAATEALGTGADQGLTTAYQTVPSLTATLSAGQAGLVSGVLEVSADAAGGGDDLYAQLYDAAASAAIAGSERHIASLQAGQRGQIALLKLVPAAASGRSLVVQVKNAAAARGTVHPASSLLETLMVTGGSAATGGSGSGTGPGGISAPVLLWLKADAGVTISGSAVSAWADQSGSGNSFVQSAAASQPAYAASAQNGLPGLVFASPSASQYQFLSAASPLLLGAAFSIFLVLTSPTPYYGGTLIGAASCDVRITPPNISTGQGYFNYGNALSAFTIYEQITSSASTSAFFLDAAPETDTMQGSYSSPQIGFLGGLPSSGAGGFNGTICEVLVYGAALTDAQRGQVEAYLKGRYSL